MRTLAWSTVLSAAIVVVAPPVAGAQQAPASSQAAVLSSGDSVRIVVWRKPELSGDFEIAPDGSISHPLFRAVKVAGLPFSRAQAALQTFLTQFEENPQFVMEPLIHVSVSGYVTRPAVFAVRPETSIGEAVARAGGVDENGARNHVRVLRLGTNGQQTQTIIDLTDQSTTAPGLMPIRSGDQIIVDKKKSFFKDILLPTIGVIGSIASLGLLIDRVSRRP
jgi:polysaccharide biosynthesis/export protein